MQVVKEKNPTHFSNLNFAKIFYLPPISCRGEFWGDFMRINEFSGSKLSFFHFLIISERSGDAS